MSGVDAGGIKIRLATAADDGAIGELLVRGFVLQYARILPDVVVTDRRKAELRDVARKRAVAKVWVAEMAGEIVGTVALWAPGAEGSEAWIGTACDLRHLVVNDVARGRGVSNMLLAATEEEAWRIGATHICLHVRHEAQGVARVYQRRGYVRILEGDIDQRPDVLLDAYVLARPA